MSCRLNRNDAGAVASAFVKYMATNNAKAAKDTVSPEQWSKIDAWMSVHQALHCSSREWETGAGGVGGYNEESDTWTWQISYQCVDNETLFCFSIDDIVLKRNEKGWQIVEWGAICEKRDYCYACP